MNIKPFILRIHDRISTKLGLLLLSIFLLILFSLGNILYYLFINFFVTHIMQENLERGHSYAEVLSDNFTKSTIAHVARMEKDTKNIVVILDANGTILDQSKSLTPLQREYIQKAALQNPSEDRIMEMDWRQKPYLVTHSPIMQNDALIGTVIMFSETGSIREAVNILKWMLLTVGIVTLLLVGFILFVISRMIVHPLVIMKKLTRNIARGIYTERLTVQGNDEVAQLAASINHMSDEIQYYQKQRNDFLADIGHELKTPITYLKGYAEILLDPKLSINDRQQYLKIIQDQSIRLHRLVQDLFDLSRMERGDFTLNNKWLVLEDILLDTLSFVEPSMEEKGISLTYTPPSLAPIRIFADKDRLEQVFLNLLENARRYTPSGGSVHVHISIEPSTVSIHIQDTGPGIPDKDLPLITERLYRVDKSRSQATGGSGLGLAISKKIIEMHHGELFVESIVGKGSTFTIKLPLSTKNTSHKK